MASQQSLTPELEWQEMKQNGDHNEALDKLMSMVGLEEVKAQFLSLKDKFDVRKRCYGLQSERFTTLFLGNPGTGKTTIARLYSEFLHSLDIFQEESRGLQWTYMETSGSSIANQGISGLEECLKQITSVGVGVMFIDETYQLVNGNTGQGSSVLDCLLSAMENLRDQIVFIFAGYKTDMEKFFTHNTGIHGRIGYTFKFEDYNESQIQQILQSQIETRYGGAMKIEPCSSQPDDPNYFVKAVARRISSGRNREGFANARAVENAVFQIDGRLCQRLKKEERYYEKHGGEAPNYFLMTEEDLLGPSSSKDLFGSKAWKELEAMIGLKSVKESVRGIVAEIQINRLREIQDKPPLRESLNKVFLGNPGTGKTTVAKLYGQILVKLGMLSNGEVVVKTPADFIGAHLGASEQNTKAILESTKGKVLVIDEAYQLNGKSGAQGTPGISDPYKAGVIDTLVANVHSQAGDDRCVLLLGYKDKMEQMYQDANPGLKRRFPLDNAFVFEDYTTDELRQIWRQKLRTRALDVSDGVEDKVLEILERQRHKLNFGNAGEVDIILDNAQKRYQQRIQDDPSKFSLSVKLEPSDIDPDFERLVKAAHDVEELFKGVIGCDEVKEVIRRWPHRANTAKRLGLNITDRIPMTMCFTGPPGTGKTTTAKNIGTVMYSIGLLASNEVNVISATELVGEYIGHTGPKVRRQFEASLGKVLFIDEAYRLRNSNFGKEAVDEIVTCLTEDRFKSHLVVIFAGYEKEIKNLMNFNPGMGSRVQETIRFPPLSATDAIRLLDIHVNKSPFTANCLKNGGSKSVLNAMNKLVNLSNWANGRSVDTMRKRITNATIDEGHGGPQLRVREKTVIKQLKILQELEGLIEAPGNTTNAQALEAMLDANIQTSPPKMKMSQKTPTKTKELSKTPSKDIPKTTPKEREVQIHTPPMDDVIFVSSISKRRHNEYVEANPATKNESTPKKAKLIDPSAGPPQEHRAMTNTVKQARKNVKLPGSELEVRTEIPLHGRNLAEDRIPKMSMKDMTPEMRRIEKQLFKGLEDEVARWSAREMINEFLQASNGTLSKKKQDDEKKEMEARAAEQKRKEEEQKRKEEEEKKREEEQQKKEEMKRRKERIEQRRKMREEKERKEKEREERKKREEEALQQKLKELGRCPANYDWIDQGNGSYRCAGGSHYATAAELLGRQ
ncbi:P-loop containing nucleoside triphosphate hydrolase protein [Biscogniauxia marginata]|nr:P-loop containing nucleoside triphosphate hydrolase protein [Biscogniauxia marginata]